MKPPRGEIAAAHPLYLMSGACKLFGTKLRHFIKIGTDRFDHVSARRRMNSGGRV